MINEFAPTFFQSIVIPVPRKAIYTRLGYRKELTQAPLALREKIESFIDHAVGLIELKGSALFLPVEKIEGTTIVLKTGDILESDHLARMLSGCSAVLLMGTTAGTGIMDEIHRDTLADNLTRGVVLDATASEMTDEALEWIMGYGNQGLKRQGKGLTKRRYSAGYGDFALENQKIMYELLKMHSIGVKITGDYLLVPEKSVTAIAGVVSSRQ
jgi:hypothetical protein